MQRIAFIDHAYHQVTKSANFFVDLLRERFDVSVYYDGTQSQSFVNDIVMAEFDIIVLWQTEYLAPYFIAASQRVVCVPMYDGAGQAPQHYWHHMRQARHINFCQALHTRVCRLGLTSLPVQYMKNPADFTPVSDYSTPRVVFWQRRPEDGLTAAKVRRIIGPDLKLHVHNAPDLVSPEQFPAKEADSVSYFDLDRNALADAMDQGNVFVCPRLSEGIGMAMIEAMARGMVVIAHNAPTQNEYIVDGVNGFLVNATELNHPDWPLDLVTPAAQKRRRARKAVRTMPAALRLEDNAADEWQIDGPPGTWPDPSDAWSWMTALDDSPDGPLPLERLGSTARELAQAMYENWLNQQAHILDFIEETPRPTGLRISRKKLDFLARKTEMWHHHPKTFIANMAYWESRGIVLQDRQRLPRHARKRLRQRRSWWFRGLRVIFRQAKAVRGQYRYLRDMVRRRL